MDEGASLPRSPRRAVERQGLGRDAGRLRRAPGRASRRRRRGGRGALPAPAGGAARRSGGAGRAGAHRVADGRRAGAGAAGGGRRRSQRATRPSARRWRCAPRSWPRRRRTICRGRRGWPGGRWRPCPAMRRRRTCWNGCTRRSGSGASWSRWWRCRRAWPRSANARPEPAGAAREGARETSTRFERVGALYEERLQDPGKALALYGEWAELGERRPTRAARAAARRREGGRRAGRRGGGAQARDRDRGVSPPMSASPGATARR